VDGVDPDRWAAPSQIHERRPGPPPVRRATDKKKTMSKIAKLAHLGINGGRFPLSDMFDNVRRALSGSGERRSARPLQDIDGWSDQAEVAYYEACRACR
jgi:hypothetical protein